MSKIDINHKGTTLAEVAGAGVAVAMLILCLASAAGGVRRTSKDTHCLMNLSQTGLASSIYSAQDPSDMAIPVHHLQFAQNPGNPTYIGAYEWGGKSGKGWDTWLGPADPLNSKYGTKAGFGPNTRPLNGIIYRETFADHLNPALNPAGALADSQQNLDVQHCPADTGYSGIHFPTFRDSKLSSFDHFGTSYTANVFSLGTGGSGSILGNSPYLRKLSEVPNPVKTVAYYENNGRYAWSAGPTPPDCDFIGKTPVGPVRGWHGKNWTFNAAFVDGHVETIHMRGFVNRPLPYCPPSDFYESPSQCSQRYSCTILRGEGWQLDTLPGDLLDTGLEHNYAGRPSWEHGIE